MGIDLDFDGMTYDELVEMKYFLEVYLYKKKETVKDAAWKKVINALSEYLKLDRIEIYGLEDGESIWLDPTDDYSETGAINIQY